MTDTSLLVDLGLVIIAATVISLLMGMLKQPLVLGYVIGGFLIGPALFGIVNNPAEIAILSELGIAFLLFIIGLELNIAKIKHVGGISVIVGFFQVLLTFGSGLLAFTLLGFDFIASFYVGLAVAFSSTMVVIKILADNRELESLHGQIVLGVMLIQDILAVFALSLLPTLTNLQPSIIGMFFLKIMIFVAALVLVSRFVVPFIMKQAQHNSELIFLAALSIIFGFSYLAIVLNFSIAIGAFLAGLALSVSPLHLDIGQKIAPLRDFFLVMFFVTFGMQVRLDNFSTFIIPIVVIVLVSMPIKAFITFALLKLFKYGNRTAFLTGVQKAQVSEFSLVLMTVGVSLGHISQDLASIVTIAALFTILLTPYVIGLDDTMFAFLARIIPNFRGEGDREESLSNVTDHLKNHVVLFGFYKMAPNILRALQEKKLQVVVVDHNPEKVQRLVSSGVHAVCGSMANPEVHEKVSLSTARFVISTVPRKDRNEILLHHLKEQKNKTVGIFTAENINDALDLYALGADYVTVPETLAGEKVANYFEYSTPAGIRKWGKKHRSRIAEQLVDDQKWAQ